jgi:hypothetical protein
MILLTFVYVLFFFQGPYALNNGLGRTPQMGKMKKDNSFIEKNSVYFFTCKGWNSWNHFHCGINETIVRQTADAMVATGLAAAGYQYGVSLFIFCFVSIKHQCPIGIYSEYGRLLAIQS